MARGAHIKNSVCAIGRDFFRPLQGSGGDTDKLMKRCWTDVLSNFDRQAGSAELCAFQHYSAAFRMMTNPSFKRVAHQSWA
jgi:hypothetical protein